MLESKKLILLADDDENLREILKLKLETTGFEIIAAVNGKEVLDKLTTLERKPDLIILDVMMPDMDGVETALQISENKKYKGVPFIFLTGFGEDIHPEGEKIDEKFAKEIGAVKFVRKGEDLDEIVKVINEVLK
jgi:CheY-like chemotaxis protein